MKRCSRCGSEKPTAEFYRDKRTPDGFKSQCKTCHSEGNLRTRDLARARNANRECMRRARQKDPEKFRAREREAARRRAPTPRLAARAQLNLAVRRGEIVRPERCARCGRAGRIEGHHPDYAAALSVAWLCSECHGQERRS